MKKTLVALLALGFSFNASAEDYTNFVASDNVVGKLTAPVTFIEYASMTCGHCATFDKQIVQPLKKEFVETGKVAYAFRDMPLDELALAVSKVSRCAPKESYYNFVSAYFASQKQWIMSNDKLEAITNIAKMGGMTAEKVQECILNPKIHQQVQEMKNSGISLGVNSTPSFFINGKMYRGNLGYERIRALIQAELGE
ncbi:MAG TPA: disulfide bond formation protein DsbA [Alphaproteobacteria bacterium]|nr:disulfide bond formation protein DsbA [Alphaproteobacteria bacterium]